MADNRIAYGIAKGLGIDTADMSPKEVWEAIAKKKGVSVEQAQKQSDGNGSKEGRKTAVEKLQKLTEKSETKEKPKDRRKATLIQLQLFAKMKDDLEVVEVDLTADIQKQFDNATPKERSKIAYDYIMDNLRGKYPTTDSRTVAIEKIGAKKISHTLFEPKIKVVPELGYLIKSGKLENIKEVEHKVFSKFAYYKVSFKIGNEKYNAILNVGIRANGDSTLYDINQFERQ